MRAVLRSIMRIVITLLLLSVLGGAQTDTRIWQVRFGSDGDTPLTVSSNAGLIEFRNDKGVVFTIPSASITAIFHSRQQIRRSTQAFEFFERICCGGTDSHLLSALAFLVATPFGSSESEYVEIDWQTRGPGTVQLRLGRDDYAPFMDWVSHLSGVRSRDLEQEKQAAVQIIEQRAGDAFPVSDYVQGETREYQVLSIESDHDLFLYLFRGTATPKNLVSIVPVVQEWANNDCVTERRGRILRDACKSGACPIRAVLTRRSTYRPGGLPHTFAVRADGLSPSECIALPAHPKDDENESSSRPTIRRRDQ